MYEESIHWLRTLGANAVHGNVSGAEAADRLASIAVLHERIIAEQAPPTRCFFCGGAAHPASGCQYTRGAIACGPCVREFWAWGLQHINGKGRRNGLCFYDHVGRT